MPRAPKRCSHRDCDERMPCPDHTRPAWAGSERRSDLPSNWSSLSKAKLREQPTCQLAYEDVCTVVSTEVDHIGRRDDHRWHMLRGVCHECHSERTAGQSGARRGSNGRSKRGQGTPPPGGR